MLKQFVHMYFQPIRDSGNQVLERRAGGPPPTTHTQHLLHVSKGNERQRLA